jgi:hypothetical protein
MSHWNLRLLLAAGASLTAFAFWNGATGNEKTAPEKERELRRARRETKMLDTLYKTAIVSVTQTYVQDGSSTAAITTFQPVLKAMKEGKWHEVRLVDGLNDPINPDNSPKDAFEKRAIREMLAGKELVDSVEMVDGKEVLRTMTILPMALDKCVLCHENYRGKKIVGGVAYQVPILQDGE